MNNIFFIVILSSLMVLNEHQMVCATRVTLECARKPRLKALIKHLTAETVQGAALALERVDDIHGGDGLSAGVLGVGHRIADDVLEEYLEDTAGLFVDETRDALDTTTACETADRRLRDPLDVITEDLAVTLSAALPKTFTTFTTTRHCCCCLT